MQGPDPHDPVCADRPTSRSIRRCTPASPGCASPAPAAISAPAPARKRLTALGQRRHSAGCDAARSNCRKPPGRAPRPMSSPQRRRRAAPGTAAHAAARFRSRRARPADRRRAGPAAGRLQAQKFRRWYRDAVLRLFEEVDAILAPGHALRRAADRTEDLRAGRAGSAAAAEYRHLHAADLVHRPAGRRGAGAAARGMPIGVQIIAAPWREDVALRIAHDLEARGIVRAPRPPE